VALNHEPISDQELLALWMMSLALCDDFPSFIRSYRDVDAAGWTAPGAVKFKGVRERKSSECLEVERIAAEEFVGVGIGYWYRLWRRSDGSI
jgi:hypothetical protein